MFARVFAILIASSSLLCGCANTKQAQQADSNSMIQKPPSDEIHGEVGVMYSASVSRH